MQLASKGHRGNAGGWDRRDPLACLPPARSFPKPERSSRRCEQRARKEWRVEGLLDGVVKGLKELGGLPRASKFAPTRADAGELELSLDQPPHDTSK